MDVEKPKDFYLLGILEKIRKALGLKVALKDLPAACKKIVKNKIKK